MPDRRVRAAVTVEGIRRSLFSIVQKPNGELIIPLGRPPKYGTMGLDFNWDDLPGSLEQRITIHNSDSSPDFTTTKRTTSRTDATRQTSVALTDAVKLKSGFSPIFTRRVEYLGGDDTYASLGKLSPGDKLLSLPEYDRRVSTLFYALLVGSPDVEFDLTGSDAEVAVVPMLFDRFQVVGIFSLYNMPSHYSGEYAYNVTRNPLLADGEKQELLWSMMEGKPPLACLAQYEIAVDQLARRVLAWMRTEATAPSAIAQIDERLTARSRHGSVTQELDSDATVMGIPFPKP